MKFNFKKLSRYLLLPLAVLLALPLQAVEPISEEAEGGPVLQSNSAKIEYFQEQRQIALDAGNAAAVAYYDQAIAFLMGKK